MWPKFKETGIIFCVRAHTVLEMADQKYKLIRDNLPTRMTFFDDIRALTRYLYFPTWESLLLFMIQGLELDIPDTS